MRLEIVYSSRYDYSPPVRDGTTALRLRPVPRAGLHVASAVVRPAPGDVSASYLDGWGTAVDIVECLGIHETISFEMTAVVETSLGESAAELSHPESVSYLLDSPRVRLAAVDELGWGLVPMSWTAVETALAWMPQRFQYQVGATDASTPIESVIAQGVGVCQDFAHIFLALLRSWGFHARYVSGYFFSAPPATQRIEAEAMHAWIEVFRPNLGWTGLDATHGQYVDERYVPVAYGRDYDDVRPIRGVVRGATLQRQSARLQIQQQQ